MMRLDKALVAVGSLLLAAASARAAVPADICDALARDDIREIAYERRGFWLRGTNSLYLLSHDGHTLTRDTANALVIASLSSGLWKAADDHGTIVLYKRVDQAWIRSFSIPLVQRESFLGLVEVDGNETAVTTKRLVQLGPSLLSTQLRPPLPVSANAHSNHHVAVTGDKSAIYVGFDRGEFGGGLWRIELAGSTSLVGRSAPSTECNGILDPECAPITSVVTDPTRRDCIIVSTGLEHHGRTQGAVVRVCRESVTALYPGDRQSGSLDIRQLVASGTAIYVSANGKVYHVDVEPKSIRIDFSPAACSVRVGKISDGRFVISLPGGEEGIFMVGD